MMIKGITVTLHQKTQTGVDGFNQPIYQYEDISVDNVLVAPASTDDIVNATNLYGKKVTYILGIPKGDTHDWEDQEISFWGERYHSFGFATEGIEENIPLSWNKKVMVERYG